MLTNQPVSAPNGTNTTLTITPKMLRSLKCPMINDPRFLADIKRFQDLTHEDQQLNKDIIEPTTNHVEDNDEDDSDDDMSDSDSDDSDDMTSREENEQNLDKDQYREHHIEKLHTILKEATALNGIIESQMNHLHASLSKLFSLVYPELATSLPSPLDYARAFSVLLDTSNTTATSMTVSDSLTAVTSSSTNNHSTSHQAQFSDDHEKTQTMTEALSMYFPGSLALTIIVGYDQALAALPSGSPSSSLGPLTSEAITAMKQAAGYIIKLHQYSQILESFFASRVIRIAPNLSALLSPICASALLTQTVGGLYALVNMPASNIASIGQNKQVMAGVSASEARRGIIYQCPLLQECPPNKQKRALHLLCTKVALCARYDYLSTPTTNEQYTSTLGSIGSGSSSSSSSSSSGSNTAIQSNTHNNAYGIQIRNEIIIKLSRYKQQYMFNIAKALPIPTNKRRKQRGGKRARAWKAKNGLSEIDRKANYVRFGEAEVVDGMTGIGLGLIGQSAGAGHGSGYTMRNTDRGGLSSGGKLAQLNATSSDIDSTTTSNNPLSLLALPPPPDTETSATQPHTRSKSGLTMSRQMAGRVAYSTKLNTNNINSEVSILLGTRQGLSDGPDYDDIIAVTSQNTNNNTNNNIGTALTVPGIPITTLSHTTSSSTTSSSTFGTSNDNNNNTNSLINADLSLSHGNNHNNAITMPSLSSLRTHILQLGAQAHIYNDNIYIIDGIIHIISIIPYTTLYTIPSNIIQSYTSSLKDANSKDWIHPNLLNLAKLPSPSQINKGIESYKHRYGEIDIQLLEQAVLKLNTMIKQQQHQQQLLRQQQQQQSDNTVTINQNTSIDSISLSYGDIPIQYHVYHPFPPTMISQPFIHSPVIVLSQNRLDQLLLEENNTIHEYTIGVQAAIEYDALISSRLVPPSSSSSSPSIDTLISRLSSILSPFFRITTASKPIAWWTRQALKKRVYDLVSTLESHMKKDIDNQQQHQQSPQRHSDDPLLPTVKPPQSIDLKTEDTTMSHNIESTMSDYDNDIDIKSLSALIPLTSIPVLSLPSGSAGSASTSSSQCISSSVSTESKTVVEDYSFISPGSTRLADLCAAWSKNQPPRDNLSHQNATINHENDLLSSLYMPKLFDITPYDPLVNISFDIIQPTLIPLTSPQ